MTARERIVVGLSGGAEGETLIRKAAGTPGADVLAVHVTRADGLAETDHAGLLRQRALVEELGGTYHQVLGDDVPRALLDFARGVNATQLVAGTSKRILAVIGEAGPVDVRLVAHQGARFARRPPALTRARRLAGWVLAVAGLPALTAALIPFQDNLSLSSHILLFLLLVVGVALVGGTLPAITAAVGGFLLLNWFFTPPLHTLTISEPESLLALVTFVVVAAVVSAIVDLAARRTREAARAGAAAEVLSTLAGNVLRGEAALPSLLGRLREAFGLASVTLLERDGDDWRIVATAGGPPSTSPTSGDGTVVVDESLVVVLRGRPLDAADRQVVEAFAAQAAVALRQQRLAEEAERAGPLEEADRMRTALLAAVSHDLRTPLASAKAAVESLRGDIDWSPGDRGELLATADESLVKLDRLVANLLDMSRLQAGTLGLKLQPVALIDVLPRAVEDHEVSEVIPADLPDVDADPALLERILANLVSNAVRYSPGKVSISATAHNGHVEIRVADRGPGIPAKDHDRVFLPFQRLGDRDNHTGVGLGLALSRGLAEAMAGTLLPEETPGGGLTMVLTLPESQ